MKRVLILLGAPTLFSGAAFAGKRQIALSPPPRATSIVQRNPAASQRTSGVQRRANAQLLDVTRARAIEIDGDTLSLAPGDVVQLPFASVTRIITEDDEVARAFFQNGTPVLQALSLGTTTIEIYQSSGTPRVLTVSVKGSRTEVTPTAPSVPIAPPLPDATPVPLPTPIPQSTPVALPPSTFEPVPPTVSGSDLPALVPLDLGAQTAPGDNSGSVPNDGGSSIVPVRSGLTVGLRVAPASDDPSQAQFAISFSNTGTALARGVVVRFPLDERVKYVSGSATNGGNFDAQKREVVWRVGDLSARSSVVSATLRVAAIKRSAFSFASMATIEESGSGSPISSPEVTYSTTTTPLLTVFALPDRFLASAGGPRFTDLNASQVGHIEQLKQMGIVTGVAPGLYAPSQSTQRAEYAVMTLRSLNLRDLRDQTQLKFVLSRPSTVSLWVQNSSGKRVADLVRETAFVAGEHTVEWNGKTTGGLAPAGKYTYICVAKDGRGETTTLRGVVNVVNASPVARDGVPSFVDVKASDWFARYLAVGQKQELFKGFPDGTFRPLQSVSRAEATAIVVRALGLSDAASKWADKDVGFLDYNEIPPWARGSINVATTVAKTAKGSPIIRGTAGNRFEPLNDLSRAQAALIMSRLIDRETTRHITISGSIVPGAVVSINSRPISADGDGQFSFSLDMMTSTPTTLSVVDTRSNVY